MSSKVRIFDFTGNYLAEGDHWPSVRSWVRSDYGRAVITIATNDPACTERNLRYGNLVYIEHIPSKDDVGNARGKLPPWVGFIDTPRVWGLGTVQITAYSIENLMKYRGMPQGAITGKSSVLYTTLINNALAVAGFYAGGTPVYPGTIQPTDPDMGETLTGSAYDHIISVSKRSKHDWNITGTIDTNGKLWLYANWYGKIGQPTSLTLDDSNSRNSPGTPILTENGPLYNACYGQGGGGTAGARPISSQHNDITMARNGIRHTIQTFTSATTQAAVDAATIAFVDTNRQVHFVTTPTALDKDLTFSSLAIGNVLTWSTVVAGFSSGGGIGRVDTFSIASMEYNDMTNECSLVLKDA